MQDTLRPASTDVAAPARLGARDISRALRVRQWAKNTLVGAGFLFAGHLRTAGKLLPTEAGCVLLAFICFCALSSLSYLVNDWSDIERDRLHPVKCLRPLASGRMNKRTAALLMAACALAAVAAGGGISLLAPATHAFSLAAACYLAISLLYSFFLKHEVIVDVLTLAAGFVVRVVAGCVALPIMAQPSPWIIFCTFTLALFVALCKRRAELLEMGSGSGGTRKVLPLYTVELLNTFIGVAAALTIAAYSLYTFNAKESTALSSSLHQTPLMMTTIPFVVYGIFRFLFLAHSSPVGGEPENMLRDKPLMIDAAIWAVLVAALTLLS